MTTVVPYYIVWYSFPTSAQTANTNVSQFGLYCLDQAGNVYNPTSGSLTFTVFLANNDQDDGTHTGCGLLAGSTSQSTSYANSGIAYFSNLQINTSGVYTLGAYVSAITSVNYYPRVNVAVSPVIRIG